MKVAISAQGNDIDSLVDPRFGRARWFIVVDSENGAWQAHDNAANVDASGGAGVQAGTTVAAQGAEVARHDGVSQREIELRDEIAQLTARMVNIKQERDDYRTTSEIFARSMHVLTIENENLRKEITKTRSATIVPMTPRR